jgi:hypothetical protein
MASMGNMVAGWGMLIVETIAKVRRAYFIQQKPIKAICREFRLSRRVVRKVIRSEATEFHYERRQQPLPRIDPWRDQLDGLLLENEGKPARERLTLIRIFEELRALGYEGSYDAVRRYARVWRQAHGIIQQPQAWIVILDDQDSLSPRGQRIVLNDKGINRIVGRVPISRPAHARSACKILNGKQ